MFFIIKLIDDNLLSLYDDYPVTKKNSIELKPIKQGEKASIFSDSMFKTMFQNSKRLKYSAKLISYFVDIPYEELLKNIKLESNELDKEYNIDKGSRCDYVASINGDRINIEVNNNKTYSTLKRNISYASKISNFNYNTSSSEDDITSTIQINLNNFSFKGLDKSYEIFYIQSKDNIIMSRAIIFIQIYVPNILKKWYNKEKLCNLEKYIINLAKTDTLDDKSLIGDEIMDEYVKEAIKVSGYKEFFQAYDKELALKEEYYNEGIEKGFKQGIEQGTLERNKEIAKNLLDNNIDTEIIIKTTGLSQKEIEELK